jgi:predicted RNA-binding protein associated with RNAse of E/G family
MDTDLKRVTVHLARLGKPTRSYQEGFVSDDGVCLKTFSIVPESVGIHLSEKFARQGWLAPGQLIYSVAKYHFYDEYFNIVEYQDRSGKALGYYCDIVTPLQRRDDDYYLTDLILDLWVSPDLRAVELDRDEFETAVAGGMISPDLEGQARATIRRLQSEIVAGTFPARVA